MRALEFRLWDIFANQYVEDTSRMYIHPLGHGVINIDTLMLDTGRHLIEQYTGIKDVTGKKIFEGDIVAYTIGGHSYKEVVQFEHSSWYTCSYDGSSANLLIEALEYTVTGNTLEHHQPDD
jgi:uncharacterized phage protein (TIGR01671 family)